MKNTSKKIIYKKSDSERIDNFLAEKLKITRSQAQKILIENDITVNNKITKKPGIFLKANDEITITEKAPVVVTEPTEKKPKAKKIDFKINIVSETPEYLVVEKPAGLLSHSTEKNEPDSLASILLKKYPGLKNVGEDEKRPGIVHRLDKEASGLMVVARTQEMFENLKNQFKNRTVEKEYIVLVHGKVAKDWDEITFPLDRSKTFDRMAALPSTKRGEPTVAGKNALTEFWVMERFINFTLLKVKIHTGRMHQIRAHMLAYNHPVISDPLYFQKKRKDKWDKICGRLFLHCVHLAFNDLDGQRQEFKSELPKKLQDFLPLLK